MTLNGNQIIDTYARKQLRKGVPFAEMLLWHRLQDKKMTKFPMFRHFTIGKYIVDFYCPKIKLAIKINDISRSSSNTISPKNERNVYMQSFGIQFLQFTNHEIYKNIESVLQIIAQYFQNPVNAPSL